MSSPTLRVVLVDDHEVVRDGIKALLAAADDIVVAGEAGSVREAVAVCERTQPDVVVMDVRLPDGSGVEAIRGVELVAAVRMVGRGGSLLDPAVTGGVLERLRRGGRVFGDARLARLSPQEERILGLVAGGGTNRQIGVELGLAEKTVKNYVSSILSKLEVGRRAEAAVYLVHHTPPSD